MQKIVKNIAEFKNYIDGSLTAKITETLDALLKGALDLDASDLHFEPTEEETRIRVRIDGILHDVTTVKHAIYRTLVSRIKLLSGIKMNITDRPQDGRFSVSMPHEVEIRTSTLPAEHGETIVMRVLNPKNIIEVESIGLRKDLLMLLSKELKKPNGMIIVTGPTGSGKTTTLYAFLKKVQKPEIKIITIEDPIEYHLKGISQTQVNVGKGYDFSNGLKSIMRQDPDVILVGEIRDLETVQTALQAALTGHLVFATLHTNDAAGTVARLVSLGADPSNIGPAINAAIAQRLVRKVCKKCGKISETAPADIQKIKKVLTGLPRGIQLPSLIKSTKIVNAHGCKECNFTGYLGRVGIFEAFLVDDEMEKFILTRPSIAALRNLAIKRGMVTIQQDGIIKVLEGITTIEEVERIVEI